MNRITYEQEKEAETEMSKRLSDQEIAARVLKRADTLSRARKARARLGWKMTGLAAVCAVIVWGVLTTPEALRDTQIASGQAEISAWGATGAFFLRGDVGGYVLAGLAGCFLGVVATLAILRTQRKNKK